MLHAEQFQGEPTRTEKMRKKIWLEKYFLAVRFIGCLHDIKDKYLLIKQKIYW